MGQPRVLFVTSAAFNGITGGGITFSNLFRGWPQDRLFTVYNDPVPVSFDVCRNYYRLGPGEIARWPRLGRKAPGGAENEALSAPVKPTPKVPRQGFLQNVRQLLAGASWPDSGCLTPELERYIEASRPQLLYTILGTIGMTDLVRQIRDRFNLPVAVHFMDDYAATLYKGGALSPLLRARMKAVLDDVVGKAQLRLAIGDEMAEAYQKRWGSVFTPVQNAVDVSRVPVARPERDLNVPMRLAYIGSIFSYAQSQSLADIAAAVARLAQDGRAISLDIYSPLHLAGPFRASLEMHPAIRLHDTIHGDDAFFAKLVAVDALVLPVNFDRASVDFIRYSIPTKVPAYLASGTPILAYGPSEAAQIAYAEREGWGLVVNRRDAWTLDQSLVALQTDNVLRTRLSERARRIASRYDVRHVRRQFQDLLAAAAE